MKTVYMVTVLFSLSFGLCPAAEVYWVGPENGGSWESGVNWSGGSKPVSSDHVIITNSSELVISNSDHSMDFTRLTVRAGTLKLTTTGGMYFSGDASGTCRVDVAKGAVLKIGSMARCKGGAVLAKTGAGRMACDGGYLGNATYKYPCVDVREGELLFVYRYGPVRTDRIIVRDGARLIVRDYDIESMVGTVVELECGGTFNLGGKSVKVAAVVGKGSVIAGDSDAESAKLTMTLAGGPHRFDGTFSKKVEVLFVPDPFAADTTVLTVGSPMAFAVCGLPATADIAGVSAMLRFAAGIGRIAVPIGSASPGVGFIHEDGTSVGWSRYIAKGDTYTHAAAGDERWTEPIFGEGSIIEKSGGVWTIDSLSLTGGTFTVDSATSGSAIVFGGGICLNTRLYADKTNYEYRFQGIDWPVDAELCANSRIIRQTGGKVRFLPVSAGHGDTESDDSEFVFVSGGTFVSRADSYYQQGLGLEASGTAYVRLEDGEYGTHSIVNNKKPIDHALRISADALVYADNLNLCYHTGCAATATVSVSGRGILDVGGVIGSLKNYAPVAGFGGRLVFDGGTIRSSSLGDVTWPTSNFADKDFRTEVLAGGMTVDVPQKSRPRTLTWSKAISSGVAGGTDGGFSKTGFGTLVIGGGVTVSGPLSVLGGVLSVAGAGDGACGTGAVSIDSSVLSFEGSGTIRMARDAEKALTYAGNSSITIGKADSELEVGAATTEAAFVRRRRGILSIGPKGNPSSVSNSQFGMGDGFAKRTVRVPVGAAVNRCGVLSGCVFGWLWGSLLDPWGYNRGAMEVRLLCADATTGIIDVPHSAAINAIPADADETTVAIFTRMSSPAVLASSARVGALEVCGNSLEIASGVTLSVGEGLGTVAPVALNNRYCLNGPVYAKGCIGGTGTLDFGGAEGVVGVNFAYAYTDDGDTVRPAEISARIAGTGGITFFSPAMAHANLVRALALSGANTYTGGTLAENVVLLPRNAGSFGSGAVEIASRNGFGAQLLFGRDFKGGVFTNVLTVSGAGLRCDDAGEAVTNRWGLGAAVSAQSDVALTGGVTLSGDTAMLVAEGATLTLASPVSGDGRLTVFGAGTLAIAANVSCELSVAGAGTVELRPGGDGELRIPASMIPEGATLAVSANGVPDGCGTLVVEGDFDLSRISLRFLDDASFRGTSFTLLRATGTLSGELSDVKLPGSAWSVVREGGSLVARRAVKGTVVIVR